MLRTATAGDITFAQSCHLFPGAFLEELDATLLLENNKLLNISQQEHDGLGIAKDRWFLPARMGGYGLQSAIVSGPAIFLSSWIRSLPVIASRNDYTCPAELLTSVASLRGVFTEAEQQLSTLGVNLSSSLEEAVEEQPKFQAKRWKSEAYSRIVTSVSSGARDKDKIAIEESSGPGAGAWLQFPKAPHHCFTDEEYVGAVRLRSGLPVFTQGAGQHLVCRHTGHETGVCGVAMDEYGTHSLCCKRGGHVVRRHNEIRDCCAKELSNAGISHVVVEQTAPHDTTALRPDICYHDSHSRAVFLDVEVTTRHVHRNTSSMRSGALIEQAEAVKRRKYAHLRLLPCIFSHLGRVGPGMQACIKSSCCDADPEVRSKYIAGFYQSISCALQRGNVAILAASGSLIGAH